MFVENHNLYDIMYNENFKKLVTEANSETYIGRGNPNAKILFVGKEYSKPNEKAEFDAKYWKEKISRSKIIDFTHNKQVNEGHTWNKYQKLHNYIFEKESGNEFDFEKNIFTTEMSEIPQKNTKDAPKNPAFFPKLINRKVTFFKSDFIKQFPVVILACSHYITPNEFCEIFDVEFIPQGKKYPNDNSNSMINHFWTHYNKNGTESKLVIHTQQLSGSISNKFLETMGKIIQEFLIVNNHLKK